MAEKLPEEKILDVVKVDPHRVSQHTTRLEPLGGGVNAALLRWEGAILVKGEELKKIKELWPEYEQQLIEADIEDE